MDRRQHWDRVYTTKAEDQVSWFEPVPSVSLRMIEEAGMAPTTCILDVGGGESRLVEVLAERGLTCLAVLDVSTAALQRMQHRLGGAAQGLTWIVADVTGEWSLKPMDIWHDRAVFHFLTQADERARYVARMRETLKPGGAAIIATFALDGPEMCSGLPVTRYSPHTLTTELGEGFRLVESVRHVHVTPSGAPQSFQYSRFLRTTD